MLAGYVAALSFFVAPAPINMQHRGRAPTMAEAGAEAASSASAAAASSAVDAAFAKGKERNEKKDALIKGLEREYNSFFQPMEDNLYNPSVTFADPLISFEGIEKYRNNVDMLAGETLLGKLCFSDCGLIMHNVTETADGGLQTRWTLQFRFKLLPWQPVARFTGVSRYTLDSECRVLSQKDYWDSVNLQPGGG